MKRLGTHTSASGRVYVHDRCGVATIVNGSDLVHLCNPYASCYGTYCSHCERMDSVKRFFWEDTDESILAYKKRISKYVPPLWKWFPLILWPIASALFTAVASIVALVSARGPVPFATILIASSLLGAVAALFVFQSRYLFAGKEYYRYL